MPKKAQRVEFTDKMLIALSKSRPRKEAIKWDGVLANFGVRVAPTGRVSFIVQKRIKGVRSAIKHTIGTYPQMKLSEARLEARQVLDQIAEGVNPNKKAADEQAQAEQAARTTFEAVAKHFIKKHTVKNRSGGEAARIINQYLIPTFGNRQISEIKRSEIVRLLDTITEAQFKGKDGKLHGGPVMANAVLAQLRKLMNWHAIRDDTFTNPIVKGMAPTRAADIERDFILSDDELRAFWVATEIAEDAAEEDSRIESAVFNSLVRTLLFTAQRREEVAGMSRHEMEARDLWMIPKKRSKAKKDILVPLASTTITLIESRPIVGKCQFVFTTNGKTSFSGFSKGKQRVDKTMLRHLRKVAMERDDDTLLAKVNEVERLRVAIADGDEDARSKLKKIWWVIHDLRRTAKTLMVRTGVTDFIAERVLGHVIGGVSGVYNRYKYLEEKRDALVRLDAIVHQIVAPTINESIGRDRATDS